MPAWLGRFGRAGSLLAAYLGMSCLWVSGSRELYESILKAYGIVPFRFPFLDIGGALAGWECARQGIDIMVYNPCDLIGRGYNYSPIWVAFARIPLNVADRPLVGWSLGILFIASLSLLPAPKHWGELVLVLAATLSTMVAFALERANPDLFLFLMVLSAGFLAQARLAPRLFGYGVALLAGLIKYYPIMALIVVFRERISVFVAVALTIVAALGRFWWGYHDDILRGLPTIPTGAYNTDLFAAENLGGFN